VARIHSYFILKSIFIYPAIILYKIWKKKIIYTRITMMYVERRDRGVKKRHRRRNTMRKKEKK